MNLKLVKASEEYKEQICNMLEKWYSSGEKIVPYAIRKADYHDFSAYCSKIEVKDTSEGAVPDSTFFCLDQERDIMVGAVNIRYSLNETLFLNGGHFGDGVVPSERKKGIATAMIGLALKECKKIGIARVLMVCDENNVASAKSIINNGGILENEVLVEGTVEQRYWIELIPMLRTITICGSMKFEKEMQKIAFELEAKHGFNVLQCVYGLRKRELTTDQMDILEKAQLKRIDISDAVYIVDIGGYIGNMTKCEMKYARENGKEIILHSEYEL